MKLDKSQKEKLAVTFFDFSKIILAAAFASEFFAKFSIFVRIIIIIIFAMCLIYGIKLSKTEE